MSVPMDVEAVYSYSRNCSRVGPSNLQSFDNFVAMMRSFKWTQIKYLFQCWRSEI